MGGLKEFRIYFDNPLATYYGGQVVSGHLSVKLDKAKTLRGIAVKFRGQADVEWKESRTVRDSNGKSHTRWETYRGHESYFEYNSYLLGSAHGEMVLPIGDHVFPFTLTLPNNLPSSFEGEYGNVRYTVKATMDRPWKFDHDAKAAFTVLSQLDLNAEQGVKEPNHVQQEKYVCCCCCKSGPISMLASVPITGYVPGQDIPISIEVDNTTTETVRTVACKLKKHVKFHACNKTRKYDTTVATLESRSVGAHGSGNWILKLKVPALPSSYLKHCNIIDINYELCIKGVIEGPHKNMERSIPIVIGTIPLMSFFPNITPASVPVTTPDNKDLPPSFDDVVGGGDTRGFGWNVNPPAPGFPTNGISGGPSAPPGDSAPYPPPPGASGPYPPPDGTSTYPTKGGPSDPYAPPSIPSPYPPAGVHGPLPPTGGSALPARFAPSAPFDPNPPYPEMPPPSYEESVLGKKDIKESDDSDHTQGDMGFAPRYPMYQFNQ